MPESYFRVSARDKADALNAASCRARPMFSAYLGHAAIAGGSDVYFLAEQMGTSAQMIEQHYGHVNTVKHADGVQLMTARIAEELLTS